MKKWIVLIALLISACEREQAIPSYRYEPIVPGSICLKTNNFGNSIRKDIYLSREGSLVESRGEGVGGLWVSIEKSAIEDALITISYLEDTFFPTRLEVIEFEAPGILISFPDFELDQLLICINGYWEWVGQEIEIPIVSPFASLTPTATKQPRSVSPIFTPTPFEPEDVGYAFTYYRCKGSLASKREDRWCIKIHLSLLKGRSMQYRAIVYPENSQSLVYGFECWIYENEYLVCRSPELWDFDAGGYRYDIQVIEIRLEGEAIYRNKFSRLE